MKQNSKTVRIKSIIRKSVLNKLKLQKEEDRQQKSLAIKNKLFKSKGFGKAKNILLYVGKCYEVNTSPIIKEALEKGKRIFLPVTDFKRKRILISEISDLETDTNLGRFGIYEPKAGIKRSLTGVALDMVVVPGICFDAKGNRLGHGKGFYDRFLKKIPKTTPKVSLAFDFQVLGTDLPTLSHDIPVTELITN